MSPATLALCASMPSRCWPKANTRIDSPPHDVWFTCALLGARACCRCAKGGAAWAGPRPEEDRQDLPGGFGRFIPLCFSRAASLPGIRKPPACLVCASLECSLRIFPHNPEACQQPPPLQITNPYTLPAARLSCLHVHFPRKSPTPPGAHRAACMRGFRRRPRSRRFRRRGQPGP